MELTGKYKKLSADLTEAVEAAKVAAIGNDGGTCNFDSLMLYLPRWNQQMIEEAANAAGIRAWDTTFCGRKHYIFTVPCGGQADKRTRQAEAMFEAMKASGYNACVYYQMD